MIHRHAVSVIRSTVAGLLIATAALHAEEAPRPTVEQLFSVQTVKVTRIDAAPSQTNYGFVKAEDSRIYDVAPRFGGYVETLFADERYMKVQKGQPLAKVYSPEVLQAKEDYLNALRYDAKRPNRAMVASARSKLKLLAVPDREIAEIEKRRQAGEYTTLLAPASGWVFEKNVNDGSAFRSGKTLFRIVDLDAVWVEAKLYQKELPALGALERFRVRAAGVDGDYEARKLLLLPDIDPEAATATLRLEVKNPDGRLIPGMYATITATPKARSRLTLPRTAVIRKNGTWYAFVVGEYEGEYEPVEIAVRPLDRRRYEILSGLAEGDEVVDNALFMMDSDAQINGLY